MDEDALRAAMRRLAEPQPVPPDAAEIISGRIHRKKRRRVAVTTMAVLAVLVTAGVVGSQATKQLSTGPASGPSFPPPPGAEPLTMGVVGLGYGVDLAMHTEFADDRTITSAAVQAGPLSEQMAVYPLDGVDYDSGPPVPLHLPAGTQISASGTVSPDCGDMTPGPVLFTVRSRMTDGDLVTDQYYPTNPEDYWSMLEYWCDAANLEIDMGNASISPNGDFSVELVVRNPGPGTVEVMLPAVTSGEIRWRSDSVTVPAGGSRTLSTAGTGASCPADSPDLPWGPGHILVNGEPFAGDIINAIC